MNLKVFKGFCALLTIGALLTTSISVTAVGNQTLAEQLSSDKGYGVTFEYTESKDFAEVREEYNKNGYRFAEMDKPIEISAVNYIGSDKTIEIIDEYKGRENVILWTKDNKFIEWEVTVPIDGIYSFSMEYIASGKEIASVNRSLLIDNKLFYSEAQNLSFYRLFKDDGKPIVNSIGDEVAPDVVQYYEWQWQSFMDTDASYDGALQFYLTAGKHTLRMGAVSGDLYLSKIKIYSSVEAPAYKEVEKQYDYKDYKKGEGTIYFEAEGDHILFKNSSTIRALNNGDPGCSPFKYGFSKINVIGDTMWQGANTGITYKFDVAKSGLYAINMRVLMNYRDGIPSYRSIAIDGEIPFKEFEAYKFEYDKKWRSEVLSDSQGKPYYVYLDKGEHTLTLTVKQGELSPVTSKIQYDSDKLSQLLLKIKMIVGQNPDTNYDYELDKQIPDLISTLDEIFSDMKWCMEEISEIAGRKQSKYYQLKSFVSQIEDLKNDPFIIAGRIGNIEEIITTYGSWLGELQSHPLMVDFIEFVSEPENKTEANSNFFERFYGSIVNFFMSFTKDYNNISTGKESNTEIKSTLDVWVSRGTKWCQIMKQMIDSDFTPQTGIAINLNVLPAGQLNSGGANALLLSITSGRAPDIATGVTSGSIGEFAMRNALVDISEFEGFEDVKTRFKEEHFVYLSYDNGIFALPETQSFMCMVYRKDILSRLNLSIPNTWKEVYDKIVPVLNQNNMQFYVPLTNAGFDMFLYQQGGSYYHDDRKTTALDTAEAYKALVEYTELYSLYGVPRAASFYNRFRSGEMPIGIADYNTYMTVKSAASDIRGKWGISLIPGHTLEDGTIDRSHSSLAAECCMIMEQSENKQEAWEFLKWWTSEDIQLEYANRIESMLGMSARWVSANWNAFTNLSWENDEIQIIKKSFDDAKQMPVVLGGYYITRHVTNALNRVVVSNSNPRDSIETAVDDINRELQRRRESVS